MGGWSRARVSVAVLFLLAGATTGGWAGRIPTVRQQVDVSDGVWGLLVLGQPVGSLIVLLLVTLTATRVRVRPVALAGACLLLVVVPVTTAQQSVPFLVGSLIVQGAATGLLFGPMNALAVGVQQAEGRSVLSSFHAAFSIGQLAGAVAGAAAGAAEVAPWLQIAVTDALLAVLLIATAAALPDPAPTVPGATRPTGPRVLPGSLLLLAGMALLTSLNEGAATQWSALYTTGLSGSVALGAVTLACFSTSIAAVRFFGDRVVDRLGAVRFLRLSAAVSAVGLGAALAIGTVPAAMVGFALLGLGSGCVMPVIFAAAGSLPGVPPARGASVVSLGEWPAFFISAPLIGALAQVWGLPAALLVTVASALLLVVLAPAVRPSEPRAVSAGAPARRAP